MAVDLTVTPWDRLVKLAPIGTSKADLQAAADRWQANEDIFAAAADLWEEKAMSIYLQPDPPPTHSEGRVIKSVSQDGISVTYEDTQTSRSHGARISQHSQCMRKARHFRGMSKPKSP